MARGIIKRSATVDVKDHPSLSMNIKDRRRQRIQAGAGGEAKTTVGNSMKLSNKVIITHEREAYDFFVGVETSCHVTLNCKQTAEDLENAKEDAFDISVESLPEWHNTVLGMVRNYLLDRVKAGEA